MTTAKVRCVIDFCDGVVFVNDKRLAVRQAYGSALELDIAKHIQAGENTLGVCCRAVDRPSSIMLRLEVEHADGHAESIVTDGTWQAAALSGHSLQWPDRQDHDWQPVVTFGPVNRIPWGETDSISIGPLDDYTQWKQASNAEAGTSPSTFQTLPGFEVRMIRSARADEDSWVSLTHDARGRWIIGKEKRGLLRLTLDAAGDRIVKFETVNDTLAECRGLVFVDGGLYAMANNDKGLYRLRDTTGDDRFDEVTLLSEIAGDVGHGRNQIVLGPDGRLFGIFGDAVYEPNMAGTLVPPINHPNQFEQTRSGFVARMDISDNRWEIVARGLRNPFGIAFDQHGEMFTYDADAEYDMGSSWYRATRIVQLLPGGDYGWRRVTQQWPPYFPDRPDMPRPTMDIGKGSPTAVAFGRNSRFPWPWRDSLFVLDWAYGRILAVHLDPRGSGYAALPQTFLRGRPLNVTDVEFGPDGAMVFVTGGRGTQSALYRVAWVGADVAEPSPTLQQQARRRHAARSRQTRRRLHALLGRKDQETIETAWPYLSSADPWLRHAARSALEWQPVENWQERALSEPRSDAALAAMLALSRAGPSNCCSAIVDRLNGFDLRRLTQRQKQEAVFLYQRCLDATAGLTDEQRRSVALKLDPLYPDTSPEVNQSLSLLLSQFQIPRFVERSMLLLRAAQSQQQSFHYLFVLRNVSTGWTPGLRETYFEYLQQMDEYTGGEGMPRFRQLIESESLATLPTHQRERFAALLKKHPAERWQQEFGGQQREFVRRWSTDDFSDLSQHLKRGRDFQQGRRMFGVARCIVCHRMGNRGGVVGPDLTSVAARFAPRDLLASIVQPSRVVAEKYKNAQLALKDGRVVVGRIIASDYRSDKLQVMTDALLADQLTEISKQDIEHHQQSAVSPMPEGLIDNLSKTEVLELLAYIIAEGKSEHPAFQH